MKTLRETLVLGPDEGRALFVGRGLGVRYMVEGLETSGALALVEHPVAPKYLAAPLHVHHREDEISYVLEGEIGAQIGDRVLRAPAGTLVFKPRDVWHTFWNPGDTPARILEIITPAGFEKYFEEVMNYFPENGPPDVAGLKALCRRYDFEMDVESVPGLLQKYGLSDV
uniref:Cupin type-2 domain-containing protein n=1 Tax=uncultured Armatimonadetes bacterium TaxID=157466 RepID=A0A6J4HU46_9BACT|nr:hypothetical protein AVDCRST_MAG63-1015 [uncultured Armatimonadetes bacterium]